MTTTSATGLALHEHDGTVTFSLSRPGRGNALDPALVDALDDALAAVHERADVHTLVLRGEGPHFCTGFDLSDCASLSDGDLLLRFVRIELLLDALYRSPLRTIAVAQGRTWGAGADLFCACERRACANGTTFRFPGPRFGLVLGTRRLAERIGDGRARDVVVNGGELTADGAHAAGLVTDVFAGDADRWAGAVPPPAVDRATQAALHATTRGPVAVMADTDLATLVRSAARQGLRERIASYRASMKT